MKLRIHNGARHLSQIMVNSSGLCVQVLFQVAAIAHGRLLSFCFFVVLLFQGALLRQPILLGQELRFALGFCSCCCGGCCGSCLLGSTNIRNSSHGGILAGRCWRRFRTSTGLSSGCRLGAGCPRPTFWFPCTSQLNVCTVFAKL